MPNPYHDAVGKFTDAADNVSGGVRADSHPGKKLPTADEAVARLNSLPDVPKDQRHFDPSFGGLDYGPEVSMRDLGFQRDPHLQAVRGKGKLMDVPLKDIVVVQPSATKGLVAQYVRQPKDEPIDIVKTPDGRLFASSGTHRLAAAALLHQTTIKASVHVAKALSASRRGK